MYDGYSSRESHRARGSQEFASQTPEGTYSYLKEGPAPSPHLQHSGLPTYRHRGGGRGGGHLWGADSPRSISAGALWPPRVHHCDPGTAIHWSWKLTLLRGVLLGLEGGDTAAFVLRGGVRRISHRRRKVGSQSRGTPPGFRSLSG